MVLAVETELTSAGVTDAPGVVVADAGYWHQVQMQAIVERGIQVLVPPDAGKRKTPRPGWEGGAYAFMRRVLATELGGALYGKRQGMIEPVFANTKFNRRIDRFQRRGRSAVTAHCDRRALMLASKVAAVAVADAAIGVGVGSFNGQCVDL